jgi:hypothetical protein
MSFHPSSALNSFHAGEQVDELCPSIGHRFPHGDELEAVPAHDPHGVVPETSVEGGLVAFEDLVYPKLVDQPPPPRSILAGTAAIIRA